MFLRGALCPFLPHHSFSWRKITIHADRSIRAGHFTPFRSTVTPRSWELTNNLRHPSTSLLLHSHHRPPFNFSACFFVYLIYFNSLRPTLFALQSLSTPSIYNEHSSLHEFWDMRQSGFIRLNKPLISPK